MVGSVHRCGLGCPPDSGNDSSHVHSSCVITSLPSLKIIVSSFLFASASLRVGISRNKPFAMIKSASTSRATVDGAGS